VDGVTRSLRSGRFDQLFPDHLKLAYRLDPARLAAVTRECASSPLAYVRRRAAWVLRRAAGSRSSRSRRGEPGGPAVYPRGPMFPPVNDPAVWAALRLDDASLRAGVDAVCARHGVDASEVTRFPGGSLPVYAVGDRHALKLFPPFDRTHALTEALAMATVSGRLPIPTPELVASGTLDDWSYVLMSRLTGRLLVDVWPSLTRDERDRLATELGSAVAALHALDVAPLGALTPDWGAFLQAQRASAVERQRAHGLEPRWLEQIPAFLDAWMPPVEGPRALLHTELMREHLLVAPGPRGWTLTGLFDFEPAMVGAPEYDLASFGLFVSGGDGRFLRRALRAYGYDDGALGGALQRRLLAYAILHRYSNLRWYLERLPSPGAASLDALAARWWSLDALAARWWSLDEAE
jgi:hygromycin-B 7''-O-kinase